MVAPSDFQTAFASRSVATVKTELEFLHSIGSISSTALHTILAQLPQAADLPGNQISQSLGQLNMSGPDTRAPVINPHDQYQNQHQPVAVYAPPSGSPPGYSIHNGHGPTVPYPSDKQADPPVRIATVIALYDYNSDDKSDLSLRKDDRIGVLRHENDEWSFGLNERTGLEGIYPRSYVRAADAGPGQQKDTAAVQAYNQHGSYGNMPMQVTEGQPQQGQQQPQPGQAGEGGKGSEMGKKFGKKLGNAAIFGAGATIGSNIVNSIF